MVGATLMRRGLEGVETAGQSLEGLADVGEHLLDGDAVRVRPGVHLTHEP